MTGAVKENDVLLLGPLQEGFGTQAGLPAFSASPCIMAWAATRPRVLYR